jgi:hypothetical protein
MFLSLMFFVGLNLKKDLIFVNYVHQLPLTYESSVK